jgi:hypothetical protein
MDTLVISNRLQSVGLERKIFDEVAQIIDEQHQELAIKKDLKLGFTIVVGAMGAGFGYIVSILNTVITKLG